MRVVLTCQVGKGRHAVGLKLLSLLAETNQEQEANAPGETIVSFFFG